MKLKNLFKSIPTHMDYEGQKLAERLFHIIILFFGAVGFMWGYYIQQFGATIIILAAGFIVSCVLVLPPWPMYRKNALDWQKARSEKVDTKREGGKKKQK
ncbi:Signal peptidase complex subunit 1 [Desmophyllum pertusum]|uniref:Signal peptidase complex subunit 1 n=1 Tax=Desmophyllum pertusum TaxID=174260 RepID=A0A9X0CG02_9CNID|nr:Signal peptidase complex subunit 1 [Desmophyllum pertusum]